MINMIFVIYQLQNKSFHKSPNLCSKAEVKRLLEGVRCQKDVDILGFY